MYATEHRSGYTTSPINRCVNKNAIGPKILAPRTPLTDVTTSTASYSPRERAPVPKGARNKNAGGPKPKVLKVSVTSKTHITQNNIGGVLNDTERGEMITSDQTVIRGVNKNMQPLVKYLNPPVNQKQGNSRFKDTYLLKANAGDWSIIAPVTDDNIGKVTQAVKLGVKTTTMDVALMNEFANLKVDRDTIESYDNSVIVEVNANNVHVAIHAASYISVEARPGHYCNPVVYDRPLYCR